MLVPTNALEGIPLDWAVATLDPRCAELRYGMRHGQLCGYFQENGEELIAQVLCGVQANQRSKARIALCAAHTAFDFYSPSTDWKDGGALIDHFDLSVFGMNTHAEGCCAHRHARAPGTGQIGALLSRGYGPAKLIAAMRCLVTHRYGEWLEVPDEILALGAPKGVGAASLALGG